MKNEQDDLAPAGAATACELGAWLRMSRNKVPALLAACGVVPPGKKFPWHRVVFNLLGLAASGQEVLMLKKHPMITLAEAAEDLGLTPEDLRSQLEAGSITAPPMHVFGERRRRFVGAQFHDFIRSGAWRACPSAAGSTSSLEGIAAELGVPVTELQALLGNKQVPEPMHIIAAGAKTYLRVDALNVFGPLCAAAADEGAAQLPRVAARETLGAAPAPSIFSLVSGAAGGAT